MWSVLKGQNGLIIPTMAEPGGLQTFSMTKWSLPMHICNSTTKIILIEPKLAVFDLVTIATEFYVPGTTESCL